MSFSFREKAQLWDAMFGFPRPANEQYLSSYKALLRLSKDAFTTLSSFIFSVLSTAIALYTYYYLLSVFNLSFLEGLGALIGMLLALLFFGVWLVFILDASGIVLPYRIEFQREAYGGRTWATVKDLQKSDVDVLRENDFDASGKGVFLAPFKRSLLSHAESKYKIFLSLRRLAQSIIIYGPPGSGKSSTFFIPVIRQFAFCGGAIVLDVKGELYSYTAHYYSNVYRLDIMNPFNSDWFDLFGGCYRNPDLARRIASYLVGYDPNKNTAKEPIWDQSAISMLATIILYLCEKKQHPTPRDILKFLAENPIVSKRWSAAHGKMVNYSPLTEAFEKCEYSFAREVWLTNFSKMPEDTFGSVKFNADTALNQLLSPKVNEILRPPTARERKKGRRRIDFIQLRQLFEFDKNLDNKRGTALYVVVSPSDALNMDVFLRVIFSVALDTLRESAVDGTNVLVALDEAGNVPLAKLPEGINTDRSKGICYFLGYQDKNQPITQYGREAANSFLGTAGVNIFLPGVDDDTAEIASKRIGETTILQRSSSDARNDGFDHEKLQEAGRKLILPQDLTEMKWFTQCVMTIKGAAPIRTRIPNDAKTEDARISIPQRVVVNVSEEVLRLLNIVKGRVDEVPNSKNDKIVPASSRNLDRPNMGLVTFFGQKVVEAQDALNKAEKGEVVNTEEGMKLVIDQEKVADAVLALANAIKAFSEAQHIEVARQELEKQVEKQNRLKTESEMSENNPDTALSELAEKNCFDEPVDESSEEQQMIDSEISTVSSDKFSKQLPDGILFPKDNEHTEYTPVLEIQPFTEESRADEFSAPNQRRKR